MDVLDGREEMLNGYSVSFIKILAIGTLVLAILNPLARGEAKLLRRIYH